MVSSCKIWIKTCFSVSSLLLSWFWSVEIFDERKELENYQNVKWKN